MNKSQILITTFLVAVMVSIVTTQNSIATENTDNKETSSDEYKLVWSDEFDKDASPDPNNWTYENGFVRNEELQWYQPENARCENGMLIIEGRRERRQNPRYKPDSNNWRTNREYAEYTPLHDEDKRYRLS